MQDSKHTPGPWERIGDTICGGEERINGQPQTVVVELYAQEDDEELEANARLIAAAPAMAKAIRAMLAYRKRECLDCTSPYRACAEALAQAEGE